MKKILLIYISSMILILIVSYILTFKDKNMTTIKLPKSIKVYYNEENIIKETDFEEYLKCVVSAEVPAEFNKEAIKAQAVAARTYIYNKYLKFNEDPNTAPIEHKDAIVCTNSKHCCAYYSKEKLEKIHGKEWMDKYYSKICKCVEETKGEIVTYENQPIIAVFHASSGGCRTENSEDVWSSNLPYLTSVESPEEDKRTGYYTEVLVTCNEFKNKINEKYPDANLGDDRNTWINGIKYTTGKSVQYIMIGNAEIKGTEIRALFGLKSACFEVSILNDNVLFKVSGSGHGVGLSQHGANIMANKGKDYKEILKWYYKGTEIVK